MAMTFKAMVAWIAVIAGIGALGISQARVSAQPTQMLTTGQAQASDPKTRPSPMKGAQVQRTQAQAALVDVKPIAPDSAKTQDQLAQGGLRERRRFGAPPPRARRARSRSGRHREPLPP